MREEVVRARRALKKALWTLLEMPAVWGALYLLALTAWASADPIVAEGDRALGAQAREVGDLVATRFAGDIRTITVAIVTAAILAGAGLGVLGAALVRARDRIARRAPRAGMRLVKAATPVTILLHAWLVVWGMARAPQAYAASFYASGGVRRLVQVIATDVLGARACFAVGMASIALFLAGPVSQWPTLPARVLTRLRWLAGLTSARSLATFTLLGASTYALSRLPTAGAREPHAGKPNVLILAADSLRADAIGPRVTPTLSALSERGTRFDKAYVSLPRTFPSWVNILTGRHAHHHGLRSMFARWEDRAKDFDALPSRLRDAGYRTAVVSDYAGDIFGRIDLGFENVDAPTFNFHELIRQRALERQTPLMPLLDTRLGRKAFPVIGEWNEAADADLLADRAAGMMDEMKGSPFLLTVFFSTAHFPYAAPAPYYGKFTDPAYRGRFKYHKPVGLGGDEAPDAEDQKQVRALYDGAVLSIDDAIAKVLARLEALGLTDDTIIVVTADHGETLFDHGHGQGHGDHLFGDEGTHVPLIVIDPRTPQRHAVSTIVRDVDIAPTLYELTGTRGPSDTDGRSLAPALRGGALAPAFAYAETELWLGEVPALADDDRLPYPPLSRLTEVDTKHDCEIVLRKEVTAITTVARHRMVRDERYKLLYVPTRKGASYRLYDSQNDPGELFDVASQHEPELRALKAELWRWMLEDHAMTRRGEFLVPRSIEPESESTADVIRVGDEAPAGAVQ